MSLNNLSNVIQAINNKRVSKSANFFLEPMLEATILWYLIVCKNFILYQHISDVGLK